MGTVKYSLIITPAIPPNERHSIERILEDWGYDVWAGGTHTDMSQCDISFEKED